MQQFRSSRFRVLLGLEERHNLSFANCGVENPMSSSNSRGCDEGDSGTRDLWYQYKIDNCGKKAIAKIVDSERLTKGMLYFVCQKDECGFFSWCNQKS
ncbi:hypothetical protein ACH5RR_026439 [Cinchona calisaya]|uniref:GRF-type domain-containing protein n=1 Tax=Cinchona calisaya TaxID=153742 RepID=A0ABD2Z6I9_9GENT